MKPILAEIIFGLLFSVIINLIYFYAKVTKTVIGIIGIFCFIGLFIFEASRNMIFLIMKNYSYL